MPTLFIKIIAVLLSVLKTGVKAMGKFKNMYADHKWRKLRRLKLIEDPLCWYCLQHGKYTVLHPDDPNSIVDHIKAHEGDWDLFMDWDNLRSCCKPCHDSAAQMKDKHGFVPGVGIDGMPLDANHPWLK